MNGGSSDPFAQSGQLSEPLLGNPDSPSKKRATFREPPANIASRSVSASQKGLYVCYLRRWWIMLLFSLLCCLSNMMCYTFAPVETQSAHFFGIDDDVHIAMFADCYFISYLVITIPTSLFIDRYGLRISVVAASWVQALGATCRFLGPFLCPNTPERWYMFAMLGQFLASLSQAVWNNPPALLAVIWFPNSERALATTIGCSSNILGIAVAYLMSPAISNKSDGSELPLLMACYGGLCVVCALLVTIYFPDAPPTPPSYTAEVKERRKLEQQSQEQVKWMAERQRVDGRTGDAVYGPHWQFASEIMTEPKLSLWGRMWTEVRPLLHFFTMPGFLSSSFAFAMAESVGNVYAVTMNSQLEPLGMTEDFVSVMGVVFILALVIGSGLIGVLVERWGVQWYKYSLVGCMVFTLLAQVATTFAVEDIHTGKAVVAITIGAVGFFSGPTQPLSLELTAECTYPSSETSFTAVNQILGNVLSALLVPLVFVLRGVGCNEGCMHRMLYPNFMICILLAIATIGTMRFDGELKRAEQSRAGKVVVIDLPAGDAQNLTGHNETEVSMHLMMDSGRLVTMMSPGLTDKSAV
eukprot:g35424.t1